MRENRYFLFAMKCISTVMSGIVCVVSFLLARENVSSKEIEIDEFLFVLLYDVYVSISERVKSN